MFEFAWPWLFALLPLPWLLRRLLPEADSAEAALKVNFLDELEQLSGRRANSHLPDWRQQLPYLAIWLLLLCASARPQWLGPPLPVPASGREMLLAVDVSGSMDYPDMQWQGEAISRLQLVKHLFGDFIEERRGDRVGLILFGDKAYLQSPLSFDRHSVRIWLDEAQVGIAGNNTAIGDAIGLAVKRLRERPDNQRVLILITDGANNAGQIAPLTAARLAAEEKVRVHTIGIGASVESSGMLHPSGFNPALELDETSLQAIARETSGEYFRARSSTELQAIGELLDRLEPVRQRSTQSRVAQSLYAWPLALALMLSLLLAGRTLWPDLAGHWKARHAA
ncbi:vWA domain-containing protein [Stutzerimonas kirkiae]|uniref:BatB protein n=1 Tax=Stutzerimonas kirkiae TaxID=2211392 RepID=A0A4Q9R0X0_9GAMM|nr:VWA domain-containing protein [Stutzerimonas kirkiae]TBU91277.1 BatB protein [Stutzerimonas kirkiae]TBV00453.1 BatB protein [Stutzerimonas kirkiae]TBV11819.1 BatB protein [Stutzerimonas kirkiae]TBV15255.1 BatB protein [Stutzerimonas kirkiae]